MENSAIEHRGLSILITGNPVDGLQFNGPYSTRDEAIRAGENIGGDWWVAPLQGEVSDLAVIMRGGVVEEVLSRSPGLVGKVAIIEYDIEGSEDDEITMVPQFDGSDEKALLSVHSVTLAGDDFRIEEAIRRKQNGLTLVTGLDGKSGYDNDEDAARARAAGWRLDHDYWWYRLRRPGDVDISDNHMGFIDDSAGEERVYSRSASWALHYDRQSTNA